MATCTALVGLPALGWFCVCPSRLASVPGAGMGCRPASGYLAGWACSRHPLHLPLLSCRRGLPTDRYMWSDALGLQECTKAGTKPPSLQWTWVSPRLPEGGCLPAPTLPSPRSWLAADSGAAFSLTRLPRFLTGMWTSAFQGAPTRKGGSTPATSLRESLCPGPRGPGPEHQDPGLCGLLCLALCQAGPAPALVTSAATGWGWWRGVGGAQGSSTPTWPTWPHPAVSAGRFWGTSAGACCSGLRGSRG